MAGGGGGRDRKKGCQFGQEVSCVHEDVDS